MGQSRKQKAVRAKRESFQFSQFLLSAFAGGSIDFHGEKQKSESRKQSGQSENHFSFLNFYCLLLPVVLLIFMGRAENRKQKAVRAKRKSFQFSQFLLSAFALGSFPSLPAKRIHAADAGEDCAGQNRH